MTIRLKEIETIIDNNTVIGFRARRSVVFGLASDLLDGWVVTKQILDPNWWGNFSTRKLATEALLETNI